ncbi:MAG: Cyclin-T2, partial [Marteilia pararefringens]
MIGERGDAPFGSNNLQFSRHLADNSEDSRESSDVNCNINWYRPLDFSGALRQSATNASLSARPFLSNHGRSSGSDLHTSTHNSSDQKQASKLPNNNLVNIFLDSKRSNMISDSGHELYLRQKAMLQVQILGNKIRLKQFCINTAMVCMHRMFLIHDITRLSSINFVAACLFLAAKIEESPISLEACAQYVISLNAKPQSLMLPTIPDAKSQECRGIMNEIIAAENLILHSLAFDLDIIHPHYMIISFCKKMKLPNQLVKVAYTFGTYILVLSNLCVRYKPSCLACICINLAYKCIKSPLGGKVETQIDAKNSQTLPDNSKKEISDHTLDHLSPPLPSSSPNDDSKTNGEGEIKDEVANKNSDDPSMLTRQNPLNTHNSSIIPMLEDCRWAENYEESLKGDLLKILTNEFLVAIQRTPNELKRTLVRQTFSGNEPEHSQIFDFLLLSNA